MMELQASTSQPTLRLYGIFAGPDRSLAVGCHAIFTTKDLADRGAYVLGIIDAGSETRTRTVFPPVDFES